MVDDPFRVLTMESAYSDQDSESICATVVGTVAEREDVAPVDLTPPLASAVDVEAIAAIVASADDASVSFSYAGYRVVVTGDGRVSVAVDGPDRQFPDATGDRRATVDPEDDATGTDDGSQNAGGPST